GVRFLVHDHTKILFRFFYALNILFSSTFGFIYLSEPIRLRFECFLFDFRYILLTRCVGIATIHAAQLIIFVLSIERLFSSIFPAYFERHSSKRLVMVFALIATIGCCTNTMLALSDDFRLFHGRKVALLNENQPENRERFEDLMTHVAFANCFSLVLLCFDLYLNFLRKATSNQTLAVSYQRTENRRIVLTLLPLELTQTLLLLFTSVALVVHGKVVINPTPIEHQLFLELVTPTTFMPLVQSYFIKHSIKK
ncbi:hypothetical protein PENTCL1PPCAC_24350, partial [Pristionchus entomophagus]